MPKQTVYAWSSQGLLKECSRKTGKHLRILRDKFVKAETLAEKKAVAEEVQKHSLQIVTHVPLGEWFSAGAVRANIGTMAVPPPVTVFWGMTKK